MTFTNKRKNPVAFDSAKHFYHFTQLEVDQHGNGLAIARLKNDPNICEWVRTRPLMLEELERLPQLDTTPIEPVRVDSNLKLKAAKWEDVKSEEQRIIRRKMCVISRRLMYKESRINEVSLLVAMMLVQAHKGK